MTIYNCQSYAYMTLNHMMENKESCKMYDAYHVRFKKSPLPFHIFNTLYDAHLPTLENEGIVRARYGVQLRQYRSMTNNRVNLYNIIQSLSKLSRDVPPSVEKSGLRTSADMVSSTDTVHPSNKTDTNELEMAGDQSSSVPKSNHMETAKPVSSVDVFPCGHPMSEALGDVCPCTHASEHVSELNGVHDERFTVSGAKDVMNTVEKLRSLAKKTNAVVDTPASFNKIYAAWFKVVSPSMSPNEAAARLHLRVTPNTPFRLTDRVAIQSWIDQTSFPKEDLEKETITTYSGEKLDGQMIRDQVEEIKNEGDKKKPWYASMKSSFYFHKSIL